MPMMVFFNLHYSVLFNDKALNMKGKYLASQERYIPFSGVATSKTNYLEERLIKIIDTSRIVWKFRVKSKIFHFLFFVLKIAVATIFEDLSQSHTNIFHRTVPKRPDLVTIHSLVSNRKVKG